MMDKDKIIEILKLVAVGVLCAIALMLREGLRKGWFF